MGGGSSDHPLWYILKLDKVSCDKHDRAVNLGESMNWRQSPSVPTIMRSRVLISATRFGDLLDFGQLFNVFGNNEFAQISDNLRQFL